MQIAYVSVVEHDVGDVSHPQLIGHHRLKAVYEVLPLVVAVVGVGRMARFGRREHQSMTAQESEETVPTHHLVPAVDVTQHEPQLVASDARILLTDFAYILQQEPFTFDFRCDVSPGLEPGLTGMAKQTA